MNKPVCSDRPYMLCRTTHPSLAKRTSPYPTLPTLSTKKPKRTVMNFMKNRMKSNELFRTLFRLEVFYVSINFIWQLNHRNAI